MKKSTEFYFTCLFFILTSLYSHSQVVVNNNSNKVVTAKKYKYRKYNHVKRLYKRISEPVIKLCIKHKVPPAAVLSIISLESGWGQGYIGKITGNFLSLNAFGRDAELPALKMPKHIKTNKIIIDKTKLAKYSENQIVWQNRPSSLKKDYRPKNIAGTSNNLDYFIKNPEELTKANLKNVEDFVTRFISYTSKIKAYNQARQLLDNQIAQHGINILFDTELNIKFINTIGGKPNSFNYRKTWPKKVTNILIHVGAIDLTKKLYLNNFTFNEAW